MQWRFISVEQKPVRWSWFDWAFVGFLIGMAYFLAKFAEWAK